MQRLGGPQEVTCPDGELNLRNWAGGTITGLTAQGTASVEQKVKGSWVPLNLNGTQVTVLVTLNAAEILPDVLYNAGIIRLTGITGDVYLEPKS